MSGPKYTRTGIRVRMPDPPYTLDLDSFEVASADVSIAAHELRLAAQRLKHAAEERERAHAEHEARLREFRTARAAYDVARGNLAHVEAGNVLGALKALPLPEADSVPGRVGGDT